MKRAHLGCLLLLAAGCVGRPQPSGSLSAGATNVAPGEAAAVRLALYDSARQRPVPVVVYAPEGSEANVRRKLAIISHGYGGHSTDYSFIARHLVAQGYFVASVQHELPTDESLPTTGNPREVRRPNWERGVQNILFVRLELRQQYPTLDFDKLLLVGHSNGGDMALLCALEHPELVQRVISLDSRRMPFPRARWLRVLSLRSSDQVADAGVLPTAAEQRQFGITIIRLPGTIHNYLWDGATAAQKREMNEHVSRFLTE